MSEVLGSLTDSGLVMRQGSVAELDTVSLGGSGVIVRGESEGFALSVTEAVGERVGGVSDSVEVKCQGNIE